MQINYRENISNSQPQKLFRVGASFYRNAGDKNTWFDWNPYPSILTNLYISYRKLEPLPLVVSSKIVEGNEIISTIQTRLADIIYRRGILFSSKTAPPQILPRLLNTDKLSTAVH